MLTVAQSWAKATLFLMRAVCNIKVEFRGVEKIPTGPLVIVAKHQSFWETFVLPGFFNRPIFILKRQLRGFFGLHAIVRGQAFSGISPCGVLRRVLRASLQVLPEIFLLVSKEHLC